MDQQLFQTWARAEGVKLYATFTEQERKMLQFGMHPYQKMVDAEARLVEQFAEAEGRTATPSEKADMCRLLALGCMEAANAGPDKMIV